MKTKTEREVKGKKSCQTGHKKRKREEMQKTKEGKN